MKKQEIINQIRNLVHIIAGLTFAYSIGDSTGVIEFVLIQKIAWAVVFGIVFGAVSGGLWEFKDLIFFGNPFDDKDVIRTTIGTLLGSILAVIEPAIEIITFYMFYACIILIILDTIREIIKKYKSIKKAKK